MTYCRTTLTAREAATCKWPSGHVITWSIDELVGGFTLAELREIYQTAWDAWAAHSAFRHKFQTSDPNVLITSRHIDGPGGILAEAELPCGNVTANTRLRVWFDVRESWINSASPAARTIDLLRVAIHEFGHSLGIGHNTDGETNAIMDPMISHIRTLQPWDIEQIQERYQAAQPPPADDACRVCFPFLQMLGCDDTEARRGAIHFDGLMKQVAQGLKRRGAVGK